MPSPFLNCPSTQIGANYITARARLQSPDQYPGLWSRRRIWRTLSSISRILKPLCVLEYFPGQPISCDGSSYDADVTSIQLNASREISGEIKRAEENLTTGCRELRTGNLVFPVLDNPGMLHIGVSFIWLHSRFYVSGLRVWNVSTLPKASAVVGFIVPASEQEVCLDSLDCLEGIEVSVTVSGILGLRFLVKTPSGSTSLTVGDFKCNAAGDGITGLLPQKSAQIFGITIGLDV